MSYYLVDAIYPPWTTFTSTISNAIGQKKAHFAQRQETVRKHVEMAAHFAQRQEAAKKHVKRAFEVLQTRFVVVRGLAKQ